MQLSVCTINVFCLFYFQIQIPWEHIYLPFLHLLFCCKCEWGVISAPLPPNHLPTTLWSGHVCTLTGSGDSRQLATERSEASHMFRLLPGELSPLFQGLINTLCFDTSSWRWSLHGTICNHDGLKLPDTGLFLYAIELSVSCHSRVLLHILLQLAGGESEAENMVPVLRIHQWTSDKTQCGKHKLYRL